MAARALLENPALFSGEEKTPLECIFRWVEINDKLDSHFTMFHRHLIHMCAPLLNKFEKRVFNNLTDKGDVIEYLEAKFGSGRKDFTLIGAQLGE